MRMLKESHGWDDCADVDSTDKMSGKLMSKILCVIVYIIRCIRTKIIVIIN